MCKFFGLVSDGKGKPYYFDWNLRKKVLSGELETYNPDSHTSIAEYFGFKGRKEDKLNKYEYNPFTKKLSIEQINGKDDSKEIGHFCKTLNFKKIVRPLVIKPIIYPFDIEPPKINKKHIELVLDWIGIRSNAIRNIWEQVTDTIDIKVGETVRYIFGYNACVGAGDRIYSDIGDSIFSDPDIVDISFRHVRHLRNSIFDSVSAYYATFFDIKYRYDLSPAQKLWNMGLIPAFDGDIWRLYGGKRTKVLWRWDGNLYTKY